MRILFVNQFFWPDVAPTGQLLSDLAVQLRREGHDVTVICSGGAYIEGGSAEFESANEFLHSIKILRVPGFRYQRGVLGRLLSYATFLFGSLLYELWVP
jgi:colanic acid biosynthesis glycosyl transferase WcaI